MRTLIIGLGYLGCPLAEVLLREGHEVWAANRSGSAPPKLIQSGLKPVAADVTRPETLAALPGGFDWVVNCVSSSRGGAETYRAVFLEGTRHLLNWLRPRPPLRFVFTSSTSVYGQNDGGRVTEDSPAEAAGETAAVLLETERELLAAARTHGFPVIILRLAGIYGPERGHLFHQFLRDEARLTGDPRRHLNQIHRDDAVTAILAALRRGEAGAIYNVADDEPVPQIEFFRWLAKELGRPLPPAATEPVRRKRAITDKRVGNERARRELDWRPAYPTFREGYRIEIERLARLNRSGS